jgi:hypothetical protein
MIHATVAYLSLNAGLLVMLASLWAVNRRPRTR